MPPQASGDLGRCDADIGCMDVPVLGDGEERRHCVRGMVEGIGEACLSFNGQCAHHVLCREGARDKAGRRFGEGGGFNTRR